MVISNMTDSAQVICVLLALRCGECVRFEKTNNDGDYFIITPSKLVNEKTDVQIDVRFFPKLIPTSIW